MSWPSISAGSSGQVLLQIHGGGGGGGGGGGAKGAEVPPPLQVNEMHNIIILVKIPVLLQIQGGVPPPLQVNEMRNTFWSKY